MSQQEYLTTEELARRWRIHPKTLSNWRVKKVGPPWVKLNGPRGKVLYSIADVVAFEKRIQ